MRIIGLILAALVASPLLAQQIQEAVLVSPIANKPFTVQLIPVMSGTRPNFANTAPADMGTDTDGCRHTAGPSEYEYLVAVDPYTYFAAMTAEWRQAPGRGKGIFRNPLTEEFKDWLLSKDGFHTEWVTDKDKFYDQAQRNAKRTGGAVPQISKWVIPQGMLPVEKKYRLAIECYKRRGVADHFLGKVALNAVWGVRVRLNKPIVDIRLKGGIEEVNSRLVRYIDDGESFNLDKFYDAYKRMYKSGMGEEATFVAGMTYFGFALRKGDLQECLKILGEMTERFDDDTDMHKFLRGLIRTRRQVLKLEYVAFLDLTATHMVRALGNEEIPRGRIPETMLVIAESLRRLGHHQRAAGWYLALSQIEETKPRLREEIRASGPNKVPSVEAGYLVLLGWQAEEQYRLLAKRLESEGVAIGELTTQKDGHLLNAIVHEKLGTADYASPRWHPMTKRGAQAVRTVLKQTGLAILDYTKRADRWPQRLDDLWQSGLVPDRNRLNRFHCPETGKPLSYKAIGGPIETLPLGTVLVATTEKVKHAGGEGYGLFLSSLQVVFSPTPVAAGSIYGK